MTTLLSVLLALHLLGAVLWVGGMAFALFVLRPSLSVLEPPQRLALHAQVFRRFFLIVWHAMPVMLLTGFAMLFGVLGPAYANWGINLMMLLGLIMAAVFIVLFFGPWRAMRTAMAAQDRSAAVASMGRIRLLVQINLALGALTVIVAAWA